MEISGNPTEDRTLPDRTTRANQRPIDDRVAGSGGPDSGAPASSATVHHAADPPDLAREEELLVVLRGIGAVMFLTTQRVIVARDGVERRPRTGIQSFALSSIRHLRLEMGSAPSGRIAVWTAADAEAVSMFFDARSLDRAHRLIDLARPLIARQRRRGPGERPVRPPNGPADSGSSDPA